MNIPLDPNTLTFYTIGAVLSFGLGLLLIAFTYIQPGTVLSRAAAAVILVVAVAFFGAGYSSLLPRWATVIVTNMLFLVAHLLFYTGVRAYCGDPSPKRDRLGWSLVALTALPFWYWGIEEPNGFYRSVVFSWVSAVLNGRSAQLLLQSYRRDPRQLPMGVLGLCLGVLVIWMAARGIVLLNAEPLPVAQRSVNPTTWLTVFWYILMISFITVAIFWLEIDRLKTKGASPNLVEGAFSSVRGNLLLLWNLVAVLTLALISELGIGYTALYEQELNQQQRQAQILNRAFADYTDQTRHQIDSLMIDGIERQIIHQQLASEPPVMVSGFSTGELRANALTRIGPIALGLLFAILTLWTLAGILTLVIRRQEEQERLISMLSHELKTPLATIRMTLSSLDIPIRAQQRVERNIEAMSAVIERCLESDRLRSGRVQVTLARHLLYALIQDQRDQTATPDRLIIEVDPALSVQTDRHLLGVIFSNLMDNGLKYGAANSPVTIRAQAQAKWVAITISHPIGVAGRPDPSQLFKKFYRAPTAHGQIGSGLGLYISAGFAKKLGGELRYHPTSEQVQFVLWIPA